MYAQADQCEDTSSSRSDDESSYNKQKLQTRRLLHLKKKRLRLLGRRRKLRLLADDLYDVLVDLRTVLNADADLSPSDRASRWARAAGDAADI